ncbi:MmgE/PrpD family protein [Bradyrhizobium sp. CCBAU 51753]|uniref:MmgE/PrpD family protein n=1 Tax=Bradyrhizobium sp. CCBAU 51753 TaxID=1325100 RepID=UPI00188C6192|nr:MmgE/PrpD family protein [Bradyrhizobium sp. CCBAU 51753]QOZ23848.1 hypothetical protein XH93_09625 [Bradyrhizobium sp. CCBAU 51753]
MRRTESAPRPASDAAIAGSKGREEDKEETFTLARHYADLHYDGIPADVCQEAKRMLLDTLGCVISAKCTETGQMVSQLGAALGAGFFADGTDFLGRSYEIGRLGNLMDLEEGYAYCHFGAVAVASGMTMARWQRLSGKELLSALVVGYELAGQIALGIGPEFKVTEGRANGRLDVWGITAPPVFAAVGAAARALNLSAEQTTQAYGIAASNMPIPIGGKWTTEVDLPNTKYGDMGWCALTGVFGAVSAMRGSTAVTSILGGENGLIRIVQGGDNNSQRFLAHLGSRWHLRSIWYKRWTCCGWIQYPLAALERLMTKHSIGADDVSEVVVEIASGATVKRFTDTQPQSFISLQFSIPHAISMLLMNVPAGPEWLSAELAQARAVKTMRERVRVEGYAIPQAYSYADPFADTDATQGVPSAVRVTTTKGTFREESDYIWADNHHPKNRIDDSHIQAKFRGLVGADHADRLVALVADIERVDDASVLVDAFYAAMANSR